MTNQDNPEMLAKDVFKFFDRMLIPNKRKQTKYFKWNDVKLKDIDCIEMVSCFPGQHLSRVLSLKFKSKINGVKALRLVYFTLDIGAELKRQEDFERYNEIISGECRPKIITLESPDVIARCAKLMQKVVYDSPGLEILTCKFESQFNHICLEMRISGKDQLVMNFSNFCVFIEELQAILKGDLKLLGDVLFEYVDTFYQKQVDIAAALERVKEKLKPVLSAAGIERGAASSSQKK